MIPITPGMIKIGLYGAAVLLVVGLYFGWKHHVQTVEREKVMRNMAESSAKLMQQKLIEVKKENDELQERKTNAIKIYAENATNYQRDVDNLTRRLRNSASSNRNAVCRQTVDAPVRERQDKQTDQRIAATVIDLVNSCELWINQIPVEGK